MVNADGTREYGAISFRREGRLSPWLEGPRPRHCHVILPVLFKDMPVHVEVQNEECDLNFLS